ncbi:uncharacterized protein [Diabrotica undecimpunctata]|uniref:uncharacterized protein n=1 Tax=Diabrotica undecimpunctata TaxID=50387 RepID=UPI003B63DB33
MFRLPNRRLYTWTSPRHNADNIVRNQIDYILIRSRFKNSITSTKTYPGTDIESDHNPVVAVVNIRFKKLQKSAVKQKIDVKQLKNATILERTREQVNNNLRNIAAKNRNTDNVENKWMEIEKALMTAGEGSLAPSKIKKKEWMTNEILHLMEERRRNKTNKTKYKEVNREIKRKIREAKENWVWTTARK